MLHMVSAVFNVTGVLFSMGSDSSHLYVNESALTNHDAGVLLSGLEQSFWYINLKGFTNLIVTGSFFPI